MVILVTGAARGLGFSLAKVLSAAGHTVYAGAREPERAEALAALAAEQPRVIPVRLDVRREEQAKAAMETVSLAHGKLDALINNAGVFGGAGVMAEALSIEDGIAEMDVNLWGAVRCVKHALPLLRAAGAGCVINISSEAGSISARPGPPYAYAISKAALNMFTRILYGQYAQEGLRIWSVHPGRMMTDMGKPHFTLDPDDTAQGVLSMLEGKTPVGSPFQFVNYMGEDMPI